MSNVKCIVLASLSLLTGCLIYLFFRQGVVAVNWIGNPEWLKSLDAGVKYDGNVPTYLLLYCLPDALWYFSMLILQFQFYDKSVLFCKILLCLTIALPFVIEIMQFFKMIRGTFDKFDIVFYLITLLITLKVKK